MSNRQELASLLRNTQAEIAYYDDRWDGLTAVEDGIQVLLKLPTGYFCALEWDEELGRYQLRYTLKSEDKALVPLMGASPFEALRAAAVWAALQV